ncbi:zinc finger protein 497-like isoform X2 [Melanotaenia boesemani]|uniref:zinc finger protein 497-like isoform X2 n=1 Tax=Melanotaenia boesemani TaxID=1250792 RepID=UPI001C054711|nr:zinc finger protein 497-like isoform X2 [Melanotaenia boesemani]
MFSWRSCGGSEPLDEVGNLSKTDILRGIITEKLSTAAREILAVVERTVADYEQEASGFRQQIERQRRQLEVLQPHVQLNRVLVVPDVEKEEEQLTQQAGEEDHRNHSHDDDEDDEGEHMAQLSVSTQEHGNLKSRTRRDTEKASSLYPSDDDDDEWKQQMLEPMIRSIQEEEDLKDPDFNLPLRLVSGMTPSTKKKPSRPRVSESDNHLDIRVRFLEDSKTMVLSNLVFRNTPVQDLRCPRGLQEADFLNLLKSAFPQLDGEDKTFAFFRADRSRKLQRFRVKTLTPEEIYRSFQPTRMQKIALYIKLLTQEDEEQLEEEEDPQMLPSHAGPPSVDQEVMEASETGLCSSPVHHEDGTGEKAPPKRSASRPEEAETEDAAAGAMLSGSDGNEAEALDDDGDWKWCPEQKRQKKRRPQTTVEKTGKLACEVCGVWYRLLGGLKRHAWSHVNEPQGVCGICGDTFQSVEDLKGHLINYHKVHVCSYCGKSFVSVSGLNSHKAVHTGDGLLTCSVCSRSFTSSSALSVHRWVHLEEKPHKCDICGKSFGTEMQLKLHRKLHTSREEYRCNVCGKTVTNRRSLAFHKLTHTGERGHGCEVCGKSFKLPHTLKDHMKTHTVRDRPFLCHICCKSFYSNHLLMCHMTTHTGEKSFLCTVCGKAFSLKATLQIHMRVHTGERPYKCSKCGRFFKSKGTLNGHIKSHLGIKNYTCGVCGKRCSRPEHLKVHMRTHNGERPYKCTLCDKAFTQSHCLKTHMKSHRSEEKPVLEPSAS